MVNITLGDCETCGVALGLDSALVLAVSRVESKGDLHAFLFEPHVFSKLTNHKYDLTRPDISYPKWDRNRYPKRKEDRAAQFGKAVFVEPLKAYEAASWGLFQIMGYHYKILGYGSALGMAEGLRNSVEENIRAFGAIVKDMNLVETLKAKEWEKFARVYNGPGYKLNNYHIKMQNEYENIVRGNSNT